LRSRSSLFGPLALAAAGCGRAGPAPQAPEADSPLAPAYTRSVITDPKLREAAEQFQRWALGQKAADGQPLFGKVELLPVTETTLPYGVGAYQKEPRLPVLLTTGPGWSKLKAAEKEKEIARVYEDLADRVGRASPGRRVRSTLTVQTPQGVLLSWINEAPAGRKLIHGDSD
jgi:hypothetical protein